MSADDWEAGEHANNASKRIEALIREAFDAAATRSYLINNDENGTLVPDGPSRDAILRAIVNANATDRSERLKKLDERCIEIIEEVARISGDPPQKSDYHQQYRIACGEAVAQSLDAPAQYYSEAIDGAHSRRLREDLSRRSSRRNSIAATVVVIIPMLAVVWLALSQLKDDVSDARRIAENLCSDSFEYDTPYAASPSGDDPCQPRYLPWLGDSE